MNNESDMKRGVSSVSRHYNPSILKETDPHEGMDEIALRELVTTLRTRLVEVERELERQQEDHQALVRESQRVEKVWLKKIDSLEADAAVMRGLLAKSKDAINEVAAFGNCDCDIPKGHKCVPCECGELFNEISAELITHDAGKSLLERQKEAEWLLLHSNDLPKPDGWFDRRDAFLNPTNKDVK